MQRFLGAKQSKRRKVASASGACPLCHSRFPQHFLAAHASECLGVQGVSDDELLPPGLLVVPGFLDAQEEERLLAEMDADDRAPWVDIKTRHVKNYGPKYNISTKKYEIGNDSKGKRQPPVPANVQPLLHRARQRDPRLATFNPNQLGVTLYDPDKKHQILPHSDAELLNTDEVKLSPFVVGISLCSEVTMTFLRGSRKIDVALPRRSMYVMAGDSFVCWKHAIFAPTISERRISLTFRQVIVQREGQPWAPSAVDPVGS